MRTPFVAVIAAAFLASTGCTGLGKSAGRTFDDTRESSAAVVRPQAPPTDSNFAIGSHLAFGAATPAGAFPTDAAPPTPGRSTWDGLIADTHTRSTPTVTGRTLALNPTENGTDRAVELAAKITQLAAENKTLQGQIAALKQEAVIREEAVSESVREVEAAAVEVIRARNELKAYKKAVQMLKEQMKQMEREEIETLKLIVAELEKLLDEKE